MYICKGNKSDMAQPIFLDTCIHIYIYTHTKHVFCSLFFKGPLKEKLNKKHGGTITKGTGIGMLAVMLASLLPYPRWSLVFVTDAWRGETTWGANFKGWQKPHGGKKGFKNWTYGKVVSFFDKHSQFFFEREVSRKRGQVVWEAFFFNGKLSEFWVNFERG